MVKVYVDKDSDLEKRKEYFNDLYLFYANYVAGYLYPDYVYAPHIDELSTELTRLWNDEFKYLCISMPPQHPLADDTPVFTTDGWKTHGELKVGDYVFSPDGEPVKVVEVHPKTLVDNVIHFDNGESITCGDEHLWRVFNSKIKYKRQPFLHPQKPKSKDFAYSLMKTSEIMEITEHVSERYDINLAYKGLYVDHHQPLKFDDKDVPVNPYLLGYWLGAEYPKPVMDDSFTPEIIEKIKEMGVYDRPHIPEEYIFNSVRVRSRLLAGFIDTADCKVYGDVDRVVCNHKDRVLLKDYLTLCHTLSLDVKVDPVVKDDIVTGAVSEFISYIPIPSRKHFNFKKGVKYYRTRKNYTLPRISIVDAEKLDEPVQGNCITVEGDDGLYLVGKNFIPTHNSKSSMATITFPLWCIFQDTDLAIKVITSDEKLALTMGDNLRQCARTFGKYFGVKLARDKKTVTNFKFENLDGKRLRGSISIESGLGAGLTGNKVDLLIIDDPYHDDVHEFTPSNLAKKIDWFENKIIQRIRPQTKMIILHTRYHTGDLIGHLKENQSEFYRFVEMPVINPDGSLLWEQNRNWEWLDFIKANTSKASFQARYMQQPLDLGTQWFNTANFIRDNLFFKDAVDNKYTCCRSWDFAFSDDSLGDNRDYTAGVPMARINNHFYIYDYIHGQFGENNEDLKNAVIPVAEDDGYGVLQSLEFGLKKGASKTYYDVWANDYLKDYPTVQAVPEGNKEIRSMPLRDAINDGLVHLCIHNSDLLDKFMAEFESFPYGKHDDIVDAVVYGFNYLNRGYGKEVYRVGSKYDSYDSKLFKTLIK